MCETAAKADYIEYYQKLADQKKHLHPGSEKELLEIKNKWYAYFFAAIDSGLSADEIQQIWKG